MSRLASWAKSDASDVPVLWIGAAVTALAAGLAAWFIVIGWWYAAALAVAAVLVLGRDTSKLASLLRRQGRRVDRE